MTLEPLIVPRRRPLIVPRRGRGPLIRCVPTFVRECHAEPASSATPNATFSGTQGAHNLNVVYVAWNATTGTVNSIVDTAGNAYAPMTPLTRSSSSSMQSWICTNIKAQLSNKVTVTLSASQTFPAIGCMEFSGCDKVNPIDRVFAVHGAGMSATWRTRTANEILVSCQYLAQTPTGFTNRFFTGVGDMSGDTKAQAAVASVTITWTSTSAQSLGVGLGLCITNPNDPIGFAQP
jgi:hypothetical protein